MEILLGICLVQNHYWEDTIYGRRLAQALTKLGCQVLEFDTSDQLSPSQFVSKLPSKCPSIIHGFHLIKAGFPCQEIARQTGIPFIITCTGTDVFVDLRTPILNDGIRSVLSSADKVVIPFYGMLPYLQDFLPENSRYEIIPKGVKAALPSDELAGLKDKPLPDNARVVVLPGPILPVKNTLFALQAFEAIHKKIPDLHLVILGKILDEEFGQQVKQTAESLPWVRMITDISPSEMSRWYLHAEVVLNVSHAEGGSQCLLEAMSLGASVLASDITGNRAYITDEFSKPGKGTGFLYSTISAPEGYQRVHDQADMIQKLEFILSKPSLRAAVGQRAAKWVKENLNPDLEAFKYLELYRKVSKTQ